MSGAAWDAFWAQNRGCLPDGASGSGKVLTREWHRFARQLPRGAKVLDLATGDGVVMARLLEARRDLKPVGIDRASTLPLPPRGAKMRAGVSMDALPFPDRSFAAVTSQFGFEYGALDTGAAEVARVLEAGGRVGVICHRKDSPIVAHNRARRAAISWAIEEQDLPGKAKRSLALRKFGPAPIPPDIAGAPAAGAAKFGQGSAAWEIAEAIRRTLAAPGNEPPAHTAAMIDMIVRQAHNEASRIAALEAAAEVAGTCENVELALVAAGMEAVERRDLHDRIASTPFATLMVLSKPK